jgi:hypothetical protein
VRASGSEGRAAAVATIEAKVNETQTASGQRWNPVTRIAFRFAFCYLLLYALCCGNATVWKTIPFVGDRIELLFWWPWRHAAPWFGRYIFHLTGTSARLHLGVSNDMALVYISVGLMFSTALVATLIWTLVDRNAVSYPQLLLWFRFALRICIGSSMLIYGMLKVFPNQMASPSLAVLNEPLGNTSPMTMLWTLLGMNPLYETLCGSIEALCGALVLFRRTALLGTLLTAFVVSNVVLYNYFFDVPVKLFATHLLFMALVVAAPDFPALFRFFWLHEPVAPVTGWSPWSSAQSLRRERLLVAVGLAVALSYRVYLLAPITAHERASIAHSNALTGLWHVDAATQPYLTADGLPMVALSLEPNGRAMLRDTQQTLWRAVATYDDNAHTVQIQPIGVSQPTLYSVTHPDKTHIVLTPLRGQRGVLTLSRIPTPAHYPLMERGFHWVNEWGLER